MAEKRNHKFQQGKVVPVQKKAKVEYMTKDLSSSWSLDLEKKHNEMIEELNRLGNDGWILISGIENLKYATFMRIIYCEDNSKAGCKCQLGI